MADRADTAIQRTLTTYSHADGSLVYGEYGWVADLDYFDDADPGVEVVEEVWVLQRKRIGTIHGQMCEECHGEGETDDGEGCSRCQGSGEYDGPRFTWRDEYGSPEVTP